MAVPVELKPAAPSVRNIISEIAFPGSFPRLTDPHLRGRIVMANKKRK
jgi:hypothetical protein